MTRDIVTPVTKHEGPRDESTGCDTTNINLQLALAAIPTLPSGTPALYPSGLLSTAPDEMQTASADEPACNRRWWLAYTKPRHEKAVAERLFAREISYYLPLVEKKSLSKGRTRVSAVPLFPGYIFIFADIEERITVLQTNRIHWTKPVPDPQVDRGRRTRRHTRGYDHAVFRRQSTRLLPATCHYLG